MKKTALIYFLSLATSMLLLSCSEPEKKQATQPRPVQSMEVGNAKGLGGRAFPGRATATQEVNLSFNVSGTLIDLPVIVGNKVKAKALIARLDPKEFDAKLKSAQAEFLRDNKNFLRAKQLIQKGNISQSDYDLLEAKLAITKANLDIAEKAVKDSLITAPFNGQIATVPVKNYQNVSAKQVIARLLDSSQIEMVIQIPESLISHVPYVKDIVVQFDAFPKYLIPAQIKEISHEASPDTRTYPVTLIMHQPKDIEILPGMAGKARGDAPQPKNLKARFIVPASALLTEGTDNKSYVWVIDKQSLKVHKQAVQIGELTPSGVSVLSGLKPADWIVTAGIHSLNEGETVSILNPQGN